MPNQTRAQGQRDLIAGRISQAVFHRMRASGRGHMFGDPTNDEYTRELHREVSNYLSQAQSNQGVRTRLSTPLMHAALDVHSPGSSALYDRHHEQRRTEDRAVANARLEASPEWAASRARVAEAEARAAARGPVAPTSPEGDRSVRVAASIRARETAKRAEAEAKKAEKLGNHAEAARLHRQIAAAHLATGDHDAAIYAESHAQAAEHRGRQSNPHLAAADAATRKANWERTPEAHHAAAAAHTAAGNHTEAAQHRSRADELQRRTQGGSAHKPVEHHAQAPAEPHALKKGKKGGSFYVSNTGRKIYVKD